MGIPGRTKSSHPKPTSLKSSANNLNVDLVPAWVIVKLLEPYINHYGQRYVAKRAGVAERSLSRLINGQQEYVKFVIADKYITRVLRDPSLWHRIPALRRIYRLPPKEQRCTHCMKCGHRLRCFWTGDDYICAGCREAEILG